MSAILNVAAWIVALFLVITNLAAIDMIGKPRKPLSARLAIGGVVFSWIIAALLVIPR